MQVLLTIISAVFDEHFSSVVSSRSRLIRSNRWGFRSGQHSEPNAFDFIKIGSVVQILKNSISALFGQLCPLGVD